MVKPTWGTKRKCQSCGLPFYDLNKKKIICPNCNAEFNLTPQTRPRRPTPATPKTKEEKSVIPEDVEIIDKEDLLEDSSANLNDEIEDTDDDADDALIEDTSDLGASDDEIPNIKDKNEYGVE